MHEGAELQMVSGYSPRPLSSDRVLVAHVSRSGTSIDPAAAKTTLTSLLRAYGTFDELFRPSDRRDVDRALSRGEGGTSIESNRPGERRTGVRPAGDLVHTPGAVP